MSNYPPPQELSHLSPHRFLRLKPSFTMAATGPRSMDTAETAHLLMLLAANKPPMKQAHKNSVLQIISPWLHQWPPTRVCNQTIDETQELHDYLQFSRVCKSTRDTHFWMMAFIHTWKRNSWNQTHGLSITIRMRPTLLQRTDAPTVSTLRKFAHFHMEPPSFSFLDAHMHPGSRYLQVKRTHDKISAALAQIEEDTIKQEQDARAAAATAQ